MDRQTDIATTFFMNVLRSEHNVVPKSCTKIPNQCRKMDTMIYDT